MCSAQCGSQRALSRTSFHPVYSSQQACKVAVVTCISGLRKLRLRRVRRVVGGPSRELGRAGIWTREALIMKTAFVRLYATADSELFGSWHQTQWNHLHVCSISLIHSEKTQSLGPSAWAGVEILSLLMDTPLHNLPLYPNFGAALQGQAKPWNTRAERGLSSHLARTECLFMIRW